MIPIIYISTINRYWNAGSNLLAGQSREELSRFQRYLSYEYVRLIRLAIDAQRYKSRWKELTPGYLEYKRSHGLSSNIWEATGQLKSSLKVSKSGRYNYSIGFDKRLVHKGSKARLYQIAKWMEYGTLRMPPRPLFRVVYIYMSSNIRYFYNNYLREEGLG